jgi:acetylornithine deacetylase
VDDKTEVHVRSASSPIHLESVPGVETCVVAFGSDVPYLAPLGKPLLVGPGSIHDAHTDHEHVLLDDLVRSVALYQRLTSVLLSASTDA